jgi:hypothetical protein
LFDAAWPPTATATRLRARSRTRPRCLVPQTQPELAPDLTPEQRGARRSALNLRTSSSTTVLEPGFVARLAFVSTDGQTSERSERRRPIQTAGLLSRSHRGSYRPSGRCAIGRPGGARGRHREPEERRATGGVAAVLSKMSWAQFITSLWWVGRQTAPKFPHSSLR